MEVRRELVQEDESYLLEEMKKLMVNYQNPAGEFLALKQKGGENVRHYPVFFRKMSPSGIVLWYPNLDKTTGKGSNEVKKIH